MKASRAGFALPAVLWVLVGVSALALAAFLAARRSIGTAQYRISHARAAWHAEGCAEVARALASEALSEARDPAAPWRVLDSLVASGIAHEPDCQVVLAPSGTTLDVNTADEDQIEAVLRATGVDPARADSIADAILDWRDDDDEPRPKGAERAWYRATERLAPRNDAIASSAELLLIRGVSAVGGVDTLLGVEDEGVQLTRAPPAVIASLPGFGSEAIARLEELRFRGEVQGDIPALAAALSPAARDLMLSRYPELSRVIVTEPVAWTLRSRASAPGGVSAALELRLVRAGKRIAIVRRRDT